MTTCVEGVKSVAFCSSASSSLSFVPNDRFDEYRFYSFFFSFYQFFWY